MPMNPRLLRPRASGFSPKNISGLAVWLDATDTSTLTFNSTSVSQWADKSGNGRNATQATALNQPTTGTINGKQAIAFDGTSDHLSLGDLSAAFPSAATAFYVVTKSEGANQGSYMAASTSNNAGWWRFGGGSSYLGIFRNNRLGATAINLDANNVNCVGVLSSSSTYDVYLQGTRILTTTADFAGGTNHLIGAGMDSSSNLYYIQGRIGEVIYYNRALSAADIATVYKYLSKKWGFTLS